jgi:hypothetical protein
MEHKPEEVPKEANKNLVLVDVVTVIKGNQDNYARYAARVNHASPLIKSAMLKAYGDALDDMAKLLDRAKQE